MSDPYILGLERANREVRAQLSSSEKEIARLKGEVEALTVAADPTLKNFWDCKETIDALKVENEALRGALSALRNETSGTLKVHELAIRYDYGNSNWRCLEMALEMATKALARAPSSFAEESKALRALENALNEIEFSTISPRIANALVDLKRAREGKL